MKLQLAIDELSLDEAVEALKGLHEIVDIIEIGTPMVIREGLKAVNKLKELYPHNEVLCDAKMMDGGAFESNLIFDAGADYTTVLGVTDNITIKSCVEEAHKHGKEIMVDMICVEDFESRVRTLEELNVDIIAVHTGTDQQALGRTPLEDLKELKKYVKNAKIAVAGGINIDTINDYVALDPDIIIVGGGILHSDNPSETAKKLKNNLK
ncbi:3-hexulose-6-phosphate synthase [Aerococcus tenax]|uniref:3-hexulose-6-phosphate synthase n=1 Tax=Aerococcus tenax TaxID=3078812 RepID=UPI0018A71C76|nr:3-hexulose-6-phosphate synthase [Aerococcus tenax]